MKENQEKDRMKYGPASPEAVKLLENLCAMHFSNTFNDSTKNVACNDADQHGAIPQREHHSTDTFIHEFCNLIGR